MIDTEIIYNNLIEIGWSSYEAKVYASLLYYGTTNASQITKSSQVPPNRIYQILDKLIKKGYAKRINALGQVTLFEPIEIYETLKSELEDKQQKYNVILENLEKISSQENYHHQLKTYTIYGLRETRKTVYRMLKSAKQEIKAYIDNLDIINTNEFIELFIKKQANIEIDVKLMCGNYETNQEIYTKLDGIDIRTTNNPLSNITIIIDNSKILFTSYAQIEKVMQNIKTDYKEEYDFMGIVLHDPKTTNMFVQLFNLGWDRANLITS